MDTAVPAMFGRTFSGPELAEAAGLTYRRVDYYTRIGLLVPVVVGPSGPGSRRTYSEHDLARVKLIGALLDLGATLAVAGSVLGQLDPDPEQWPEWFFVDPSGRMHLGLPLPSACWWVPKAPLLRPERQAVADAA